MKRQEPTHTVSVEEPRRAAPRRPPPWMARPLRAVPVILGINIVVFLGWQAAIADRTLLPFFVGNFEVSLVHLAHGRLWTLLTAAFSHNQLWHLAVNMIVLWSFGSLLERLWGTRLFVGFYLAAAVVSSVSHCLVTLVVLGRSDISAVGASGALAGLLIAFAFTFPREKILLFGVIPIPALVAVLAFVGLDLWGLAAQSQGGGLPIGHGAHLGGAAFGALFWLAVLRHRSPHAGRPRLSQDEAEEVDRLRRKLDAEGPAALTDSERDFLRRLRDRVLP